MPKADHSDITVVLDRSGSMGNIALETIGGFNRFVDDQKKAPGSCHLTLVQFDDVYEFVHQGVPIADVPPLTDKTFIPRGWTALLDAMGRAITETGARLGSLPEPDRPSVVIFVVITDGHENVSKEYTKPRIAEMIAHQRNTYSWQFLFLGANQDAIATAGSLNIPANNAMTYVANAVGTHAAFESTGGLVSDFRRGESRGFSDADREKQAKAGVK